MDEKNSASSYPLVTTPSLFSRNSSWILFASLG